MLTSNLDRDWSDIAIQPGYLPLMDKAIRSLAKKQLRAGDRDILVGQSTMISVAPSDRRIEVSPPDQPTAVIDGESLKDREQVRFGATSSPGFYSVAAIDESEKKHLRPESTFAVNLDPSVSDLARIDKDELPVGGTGASAASGAQHRRVELWHALGALLLLLLGVEGLLVLRN